jgi:hypothetical protein
MNDKQRHTKEALDTHRSPFVPMTRVIRTITRAHSDSYVRRVTARGNYVNDVMNDVNMIIM